MRFLKSISALLLPVAAAGMMLTSCEESEGYDVNSPDWLQERIDSIANANKGGGDEEELEGMEEDVYTIGATDFSTGWWAQFSKYYVIPNGQKWNAVFSLNINPDATNTYKNFALILSNDVERGGAGYTEYGAIRFDHQPSGNSEWGDHIIRDNVQSNLTFGSDTDEGVTQLGGRVVLTIDRTDANNFIVKITNGTVTKTYTHKAALPNLNEDASNENIRAFIVPEGSYINFLQSNIEPIGGFTSAEDKQPLTMTLENVPDEVTRGQYADVNEAMEAAGVSATIEFEQGVSKTVPAAELMFTAVPDFNELGQKTLVVIYNKTFKGENADKPIVATTTFNVVNPIAAIQVTALPNTHYTIFSHEAIEGASRQIALGTKGLEVTATYGDGSTSVIDNSKLTIGSVPAIAGTHQATITTANGISTTVEVTVEETAETVELKNSEALVGLEDNTSAWWTYFTDEFSVAPNTTTELTFTNWAGASNWSNFVVILRNAALAEYGVVRADNFGWGNGYGTAVLSGGQADWASWLAAMSGAKTTVYVTNVGNGTADVLAVMHGNDGNTYYQYYLGISTVDPDDLHWALTVDGSHITF